MIRFDLPFPPSVNHYYIRTRHGVILGERGRKYRNDVVSLLQKYKHSFSKEQRLCITINLYPPNKRKFDLDNRLKALLDALQHAEVFPDDEQIDMLSIIRRNVIKNGCAMLWLTECLKNK